MAGKTLHVISHSHWDREWYLPLELHRRRLVKLLDDVLDVIDRDPRFASFHLDGQSIPLEDYLEVRPQQRARLEAAGQAGRLTLGPWYILQDEFLTSAEAQVRNLLYGIRTAQQFGPVLKVGYLADAFGHIGQMPAILNGFGIDNAVFGRGVNKYRADLPEDTPESERGYHSEFTWRGADGSEVLALYMANWYSNAMDIPAEPEACKKRFEQIRAACLKYAVTDHLLLMNGCDHTPCQLNISELIATGREHLDDEIVHSRLDDYAAAVRAAVGELQVADGELRSEYTNGWGTLTNVLSARLYLKQANERCQRGLERYLEPLEAVLGLLGRPVDRDFRTYLWKLLLQNHPHDSICGCSVDPVHREMETRFAKVEQLSGQLTKEALIEVAERVDTSFLPDGAIGVVVYNPLGFPRRELITCEVSFPEETPLVGVSLTDAAGRSVPAVVDEDLGRVWDYYLPDDRFRVPYHCRRLRISFNAELPAFGYATFAAIPSPVAPVVEEPDDVVLENEYLRVVCHEDATFDLLDKTTGRVYEGLHVFEYQEDAGDEYNFRPPEGSQPKLTPEMNVDDLAAPYADFGIDGDLDDEDFEDEPLETGPVVTNGVYQAFGGMITLWANDDQKLLEDLFSGDLDAEEQEFAVFFRLVLPHGSRRLNVELSPLHAHAVNYRLRALFPAGVEAEAALADGHFEVVERPAVPWRGWENPSNCQPCQTFVDLSDEDGGLTIANRGLPEYEIVSGAEGQGIAVTLLRGVDRLGDWGDFPTPEAQCRDRRNRADYAVIPHQGEARGTADLEARGFAVPPVVAQTGSHEGSLPASGSWLRLEPSWLVLSAVRWAEDRDAFIVRFYNPYDEPVTARLTTTLPVTAAWRCNLNEERGEALGALGEGLSLAVGAKEIVTLELGEG